MLMPINDDSLFCLEMRKYKGGTMCIKEQFKAEGKRAFHPDKDPFVLNPYPHTKRGSAHDLWLEGWREIAIKHEQKKHFLWYEHF